MLKQRVMTSLLLIPLFLAALFLLPGIYWALLALAVVLIGVWEWGVMARFRPSMLKAYVMLTGIMALALIAASGPERLQVFEYALFWGILAGALFWILLVPLWLMFRRPITHPLLLAVTGWLVLIPTWLALVGLHRVSPWLLLAVIAAVWVADSAAYFAGKRFGKHKLAPQISPGKTWEGVWGAWLAVSIYGLLLCVSFDLDYWLVIGLWGITMFSIMGDLLESMIKRHAGFKDSGSLLPGHGGVLDRIDGLTSTLPLTAFFIYFPLYYSAWLVYV